MIEPAAFYPALRDDESERGVSHNIRKPLIPDGQTKSQQQMSFGTNLYSKYEVSSILN